MKLRKKKKFNLKFRSGSATVLTLFILSGMLIIVMSGAYILLLGMVSGGMQANSNKAYFASEAGVEKLLWEIRKNNNSLSISGNSENNLIVLEGELPSLPAAAYKVKYKKVGADKYFTSEGSFHNTKRSVEVRF